jgi:hypothetical protein
MVRPAQCTFTWHAALASQLPLCLHPTASLAEDICLRQFGHSHAMRVCRSTLSTSLIDCPRETHVLVCQRSVAYLVWISYTCMSSSRTSLRSIISSGPLQLWDINLVLHFEVEQSRRVCPLCTCFAGLCLDWRYVRPCHGLCGARAEFGTTLINWCSIMLLQHLSWFKDVVHHQIMLFTVWLRKPTVGPVRCCAPAELSVQG